MAEIRVKDCYHRERGVGGCPWLIQRMVGGNQCDISREVGNDMLKHCHLPVGDDGVRIIRVNNCHQCPYGLFLIRGEKGSFTFHHGCRYDGFAKLGTLEDLRKECRLLNE